MDSARVNVRGASPDPPPRLLTLENGGLTEGWIDEDEATMFDHPLMFAGPALAKFIAETGPRQKDEPMHSPVDRGDQPKLIAVAWRPGDRVRLVDGEPGERGIVTTLVVRPGCVTYQVSWPSEKETTDHFAMELEDAD